MDNKRSFTTQATAFAAIFTLLLPALILRADVKSASRPLTDDQRILHVLNRLGFGVRPGDVEKVRAVGLQKYIDRQLNPDLIDDSVAQNKVKDLDVVGMSTPELFAKYPNPGALLRQLEGNNRNQPNTGAPAEMSKDEQKERRDKIQKLYAEYNLKPAGQLMPQIVANRVLRAVYSERQLQEVMVDFWQNHFNVFAGKAAVRWYIPSYERDVLRKNALGNFTDLVVGTGQHPAMLFYLDNFESVSPNAQMPGNNANAQLTQLLKKNGGKLPVQARQRIKERSGLTDAQLDQR
ncbi:MAG: DUF1800 family protein, partial [Pyrinomonadaceae bacterium]